MDTLLDPITRDYAGMRTTTLANAVYLRLATPLGSYWADPGLGSLLHTLQREKDLPRVRVLAEQYAEQALTPLVEDRRAEHVAVTAADGPKGWLPLRIEVRDNTGNVQHFQHHVRVA